MTKTTQALAADALSQGLTFFEGSPCKNCGGTLRYANGTACVACVKEHTRKQKAARPKRPRVLLSEDEKTARRNAYDREYRQRNGDRIRETKQEYRARRPDVVARYHANYQAKNTDSEKVRKAEWAKANPMVRAANRHARRAAPGRHTPEQLVILKRLQDGLCAYCDSEAEHLDHKTPVTRGGSNWPWNLQWLCAFHNVSKHDRTDEEYRSAQGLPPPMLNPFGVLFFAACDFEPDAKPAPRKRKVKAAAPAAPMALARDDGAALQLENATPHDLGEALAQALAHHGLMHVALTQLDGQGLWQCVTLRPGYRDQVTRTGRTPGAALANAMGATRGHVDELLDVVG